MAKRPSYAIKEKILMAVRESPATYAQLERKVNTGFRTVKANCKELELFGQVSIEKTEEHPSNGRISYKIAITQEGQLLLKKISKEKKN